MIILIFEFFVAADVQRLDIGDYNLYGVSPSDPGPMVLCNQCNHITAPEGIARHVKRVHGTKIVPLASSNRVRISSILAAKSVSGAGVSMPSNAIIHNNISATDAALSSAFSARLNVNLLKLTK